MVRVLLVFPIEVISAIRHLRWHLRLNNLKYESPLCWIIKFSRTCCVYGMCAINDKKVLQQNSLTSGDLDQRKLHLTKETNSHYQTVERACHARKNHGTVWSGWNSKQSFTSRTLAPMIAWTLYKAMDKLKCDRSNKSYLAVVSCDAVYCDVQYIPVNPALLLDVTDILKTKFAFFFSFEHRPSLKWKERQQLFYPVPIWDIPLRRWIIITSRCSLVSKSTLWAKYLKWE